MARLQAKSSLVAFYLVNIYSGMAFTKKHTEITSDTKEIIAAYTDVVGFFSALGIVVANPDQAFTIIARKSPTTGGDQDVVLGEMTSEQKLVIQFTEVTGPVIIP